MHVTYNGDNRSWMLGSKDEYTGNHPVTEHRPEYIEFVVSLFRDVNDVHLASEGVGDTWLASSLTVGFCRLVGPLLGSQRLYQIPNTY